MAKSLARILVTGSRHLADAQTVAEWLTAACNVVGCFRIEARIVHGGAPGADSLAEEWAKQAEAESEVHRANWGDGPAAGPGRNARMVRLGADICVAFYDGKKERSGTRDCFEKAIAAGIPTIVVPVKVKLRELGEAGK